MPDPRWEKIKSIFHAAFELSGSERDIFLDRECGNDADLRREVESLLTARHTNVVGTGAALFPPLNKARAGVGSDQEHNASNTSTIATPLTETVGTRIGPYKLLQQIGEGGFGVVFMADQESPVRRRVALKIIKLGMDTRRVVARFEAERQALAMMDHPNIARVLDAGATDSGRPYFVMELVKGDPITDYCDKHNLSIPERLELFEQVCHAVQHAHTKGVIHRDIKPSNVLVSTQDGRPHAKVIDFGIAKATDHQLTEKTLFTEHKALIGTPAYMSPEQAEGSLDIDTRTDVYSLGVLLYELLSGSTPFDHAQLRAAAFGEIQRIIREVEPPKPSTRVSSLMHVGPAPIRAATVRERVLVEPQNKPVSYESKEDKQSNHNADELSAAVARPEFANPLPHSHGSVSSSASSPKPQATSLLTLAHHRRLEPATFIRSLRGELDWIVMKSLDKDRARRYETANALAADVRRHLTGEPVVAAPPSAVYRVRKFVRRHKGPVLTASAVATALLIGIGLATWQWSAAHRLNRTLDDQVNATRRTLEQVVRKSWREVFGQNWGGKGVVVNKDIFDDESHRYLGMVYLASGGDVKWSVPEILFFGPEVPPGINGLSNEHYKYQIKGADAIQLLGQYALEAVNQLQNNRRDLSDRTSELEIANAMLLSQNERALRTLKKLVGALARNDGKNYVLRGYPLSDGTTVYASLADRNNLESDVFFFDEIQAERTDGVRFAKENMDTAKMIEWVGSAAIDVNNQLQGEVKRARLAEASLILARYLESETPPGYLDIGLGPSALADVVTTREELLGPDHDATILARWVLGTISYTSGQEEEGTKQMRRALADHERKMNQPDDLLIAMYDNLANAELALAHLDAAETLYDKLNKVLSSPEITENNAVTLKFYFGPFSPGYVGSMVSIGWGQWEEPKLSRIAHVRSQLEVLHGKRLHDTFVRGIIHVILSWGREPRSTGTTLNGKEREYMIRAVPWLHEFAPEVAPAWSAIALIHYRVGDFVSAIAAATKSADLYTKEGEDSHPINLALIAMGQWHLNQPVEARDTLAKLRTLIKKSGWENDTDAKSLTAEAVELIEGGTAKTTTQSTPAPSTQPISDLSGIKRE